MPARRDRDDAQVIEFRRAVGLRLRELRLQHGWSQEELGERAQLHRNHVGMVERGELNVTLDNLYRLAQALAVEPGSLLPAGKE